MISARYIHVRLASTNAPITGRLASAPRATAIRRKAESRDGGFRMGEGMRPEAVTDGYYSEKL